ncbi:MAG: HD domain-containing protein [Slackia sp.]|nr:HD domain-containing protein [Slackia sp.]
MGFPAMPAVEQIRRHPVYQARLSWLVELESDRVFCRHGMVHLLDTARIAYILNLERGLGFSKEVVYAAALLHDIGKGDQYESGTPHEIAGAQIAREILVDIDGFDVDEKAAIVAAVREHRRRSADASPLGALLCEADKASRACYACPARNACSWPAWKTNAGVGV